PFLARRRPGGDDSDDILPIDMGDDDDGERSDEADGDRPLLAIVEAVVREDQRLALEYPGRILEAHAMLGDVRPVLGLIPFKHRPPQRRYNCIYSAGSQWATRRIVQSA